MYAVKNAKRTIIVTANIALQEQLVNKDLPLLKKIMPGVQLLVVTAGQSQCVLQMLDGALIGAMQREEFGACQVHADDVARQPGYFRQVVPDVDVALVDETLPLQDCFRRK